MLILVNINSYIALSPKLRIRRLHTYSEGLKCNSPLIVNYLAITLYFFVWQIDIFQHNLLIIHEFSDE